MWSTSKKAWEGTPLLVNGPAKSSAAEARDHFNFRDARVKLVLLILLVLGYAGALANACFIIWSLTAGSGEKPMLHSVLEGAASICTGFAVPLTVYDICMHLAFYRNPLQRFYIRVLWMVIIYAVESYAALRQSSDRVYLETAAAAYEAYTLYSFFRLCLDFLGPRSYLEKSLATGEWDDEEPVEGSAGGAGLPRGCARAMLDGSCCHSDKKGEEPFDGFAKMIVPCCCLRRWKLGPEFLFNASFGVLQYVVVRLACAVTTFILQDRGDYGEDELSNPKVGYPWIVVAINVSQLWALYCLILFGYHSWKPLAPLRPLGKFLVIKMIVFLSWWQSVVISAINAGGFIPSEVNGVANDELAAGVQDLLICLEMVGYAVAHHLFFSYTDFYRGDVLRRSAHLLHPSTPLMEALSVSIQISGDSPANKGRDFTPLPGPSSPTVRSTRVMSGNGFHQTLLSGGRRSGSRGSGDGDMGVGKEESERARAGSGSGAAGASLSSPEKTRFGQTLKSPSQMLMRMNGRADSDGAIRLPRLSDGSGESVHSPDSRSGEGEVIVSRWNAAALSNATPSPPHLDREAYAHGQAEAQARGGRRAGSAEGAEEEEARGSPRPLGLLAAMTDMLPIDVVLDVTQHVAAAGDGLAGATRRAGVALRQMIMPAAANIAGEGEEGVSARSDPGLV